MTSDDPVGHGHINVVVLEWTDDLAPSLVTTGQRNPASSQIWRMSWAAYRISETT